MDEESLFLAALELSPAEQRLFLERSCGGNEQLMRRVEKLLRSHRTDANFLVQPAIQQIASALEEHASNSKDRPGRTDQERPSNGAADDQNCPLPESIHRHLGASDVAGSMGRLHHYELLEVIGAGGFGLVVKAIDQKLQRLVAIKFLMSDRTFHAEARQRFLREARVAAAIRHDHVVAIYAVEEHPTPYLVMEYLDGKTLDAWIAGQDIIPIKTLFDVSLSIAEGLAAAHAQGVIHRDIKPANILIESKTGRVTLMDFGLARAVDDTSVTHSQCIAGTPQFMSPEQAEGKRLDPRSDLFSLGSVLYFLSTRRPPFQSDSTLAVMKNICDVEPPAMQSHRDDIPSSFVAIVNQLHSKSPDGRPADARQVVHSLQQAMSDWQAGGELAAHASRTPMRRSSHSALRRIVRPTLWLILLSVVGAVTWLWHTLQPSAPSIQPSSPSTPRVVLRPKSKRHPLNDSSPADRLDPAQLSLTRLTIAGNGDSQWVPPGLVAILAENRFPHVLGPNQNSGITDIACRSDGERMAIASAVYSFSEQRFVSWELKIWQPDTGLLIYSFTDLPAPARGLTFSPDGRQLAILCDQGTLITCDAATWKPLWAVQAHKERGRAVDWSDDGHWIVTGGDDGGAVWNASSGAQVSVFREHPGMLLDVDFSHPTTDHLSASNAPLLPLPFPDLLVVSTDGHSTRVWGAATGTPIGSTIETPSTVTRSIVFNANGMMVTGAREDGLMTTWNIDDGQATHEWTGHSAGVLQVTSNSDGTRLASASLDGSIRLWDATGTTLHIGPGHVHHASAVAFLQKRQQLVSGDTLGQVYLWDMTSGQRLSHQHLGPAWTVACNPKNGQVASGGEDGTVRLWDLATGTMVRVLFHTDEPIRDVAWREDGRFLAAASAHSIHLIDFATAETKQTHNSLSGAVSQLQFSSDGQQLFFLTASDETNRSLHHWNLSSNMAHPYAASVGHSPQCFALSSDGRALAIGERSDVIVYDLGSSTEAMTLHGHSGQITSLSFNSDASRLASSAGNQDSTVVVWDLKAQQKAHRLDGPIQGSFACQWRADDQVLASVGLQDGTVQLWNLTENWPTRTVLPIFRSDHNAVTDMTLTPEGRYLITANADGTLFVVRLAPRKPR